MTGRECRRTEPLLALAAGGDLSPARARRVERHLRTCAVCREAAEAFAATIHTVRGLPALKLSPDERAELRRSVWTRIERERMGTAAPIRRDRTAWTAAGWAAAALVAVVALLLPWRGVRDDRSATTPAVPPFRAEVAPTPGRPDAPAAADPVPGLPTRIAARRPRRPARPILEPESTQPVRIELSTPDPDVRIVWLVGTVAEDLPPLPDDFATRTDTTSTEKENPE